MCVCVCGGGGGRKGMTWSRSPVGAYFIILSQILRSWIPQWRATYYLPKQYKILGVFLEIMNVGVGLNKLDKMNV